MGIELKVDGVTGASQGAMSCQKEQTRPGVERIAAFTIAARPERLTPEFRRLFKRNILDSLACAIAALPGRPFAALREQFAEYRAPSRCTLIGGGKTSVDQAALFNSGLTRYVDLLDSYMSPGGLAHPSDNFGTVLAAAEYVDASGEDFVLAPAVDDFTGTLKRHEITISMDGKGRCMDNIFVERLWRSLKYEEVYLNAYATVAEAKAGIGAWLSFYNPASLHPSLYAIEEKRFC